MKSPTRRFTPSLLALAVGAALLLDSSSAQARGFAAAGVARRGFVAAGVGYGYGCGNYWNYADSSTGTSSANNAPSSGPSLPSGAVTTLPDGAAPVVVFGKTYYFANGNYYSPQFYGGRTIYVVANP